MPNDGYTIPFLNSLCEVMVACTCSSTNVKKHSLHAFFSVDGTFTIALCEKHSSHNFIVFVLRTHLKAQRKNVNQSLSTRIYLAFQIVPSHHIFSENICLLGKDS